MRLTRLDLENFRSHSRTSIELDDVSAAAVIGRNGAGKSSLLQAIRFALYGQSQGVDDLLSTDAKAGWVRLEFMIDGVDWKVERGRDRAKKSWLSLSTSVGRAREWVPVPTHTITETERALHDVLGMTEDVFLASVFSAQGHAGVLAELPARARKQLLGDMLGLEVYETYRERAGALARKLSAESTASSGSIDRLQGELEDLADQEGLATIASEHADALQAVTDAQAELNEAIGRERDRERWRLRERMGEEMGEVLARAKALRADRERLAALRSMLVDVDELREKLDDARAAVRADQDRVLNANAAAREAKQAAKVAYERLQAADRLLRERASQMSALQTRREAKAQAIAQLDQAEEVSCQLCGQPLDSKARERTLENLAAEAVELDAALVKATEAHGEAFTAEAKTRGAQVAAAGALKDVTVAEPDAAVRSAVSAHQQRLEDAQQRVGAANALTERLAGQPTSAALKRRWEELRAERDALPREPPEGPTVSECQQLLNDCQDTLSSMDRLLERARAIAERIEALREQIHGMLEEHERLLTRLAGVEVLERAFSRNGIPAVLLDGAVVGVETAANRTLEQLGSEMRLRLETQRALRSGKGVAETLDIVVEDGQVARPLESFSGGEQYRVHIAIRLGIAQALGKRTMDCLLIDEVTDLDVDGAGQLSEMLCGLGKQVLLVTHAEDFVSAMPQKIVVSRASSFSPSTVEVL